MEKKNLEPTIVFFDGVCSLCNGFVDWLIRRDHARALRYAPLQGENAHEKLPAHLTLEMNSIVVLKNGAVVTKSDAIIEIMRSLGGSYSFLAGVMAIFPKPLRDLVYTIVARNRYRWWKPRETCRIPTPEERSMFLD